MPKTYLQQGTLRTHRPPRADPSRSFRWPLAPSWRPSGLPSWSSFSKRRCWQKLGGKSLMTQRLKTKVECNQAAENRRLRDDLLSWILVWWNIRKDTAWKMALWAKFGLLFVSAILVVFLHRSSLIDNSCLDLLISLVNQANHALKTWAAESTVVVSCCFKKGKLKLTRCIV